MDSWCILRCQGRATLRLAESLSTDGYEVWTPRETRRIRIPRMNVRREAVLPLMPSYIFARARHLIDLLELAGNPTHASFNVMRWQDRIPFVEDVHLDGLRTLEYKRTPRKKADRTFPAGLSVRVNAEGGSFAGMNGRVERSDTATTLVCFDSRMTVRSSTSLLSPAGIETTPHAARLAA